MSHQHLVRIGLMGNVGRFTSVDAARYSRGRRVICRTTRGLEVGEVLAAEDTSTGAETDGALLRGMTVEDELLLTRLERYRDEAFQACTEKLARQSATAVLMDVEHLFDGRSVYFYFLGEVTPELEALTEELAEAYQKNVRFDQFVQTLTEGCGPGCGTEAAEGNGCGSGGCSTCGVASACGSKAVGSK